jgi:hypothetical protein
MHFQLADIDSAALLRLRSLLQRVTALHAPVVNPPAPATQVQTPDGLSSYSLGQSAELQYPRA